AHRERDRGHVEMLRMVTILSARARAVSCVDVWEAVPCVASWMPPKSSSIPAGRDETRKLLQHCRALAEWRKRRFSLGDQSAETSLCCVDAKQGNQRGLAAPCVLGDSLAEGLGVALRIEQVVGELEGLAEGRGISKKRRPFARGCPAEHRAGLAGKAKQGSGLERLHRCGLGLAETMPLGGKVECLAEHHALPAASPGEQQDKLRADGRVSAVTRVAHNLEGESEQSIAGKDRRRLVEGDMHCGPSAAQRIVVHGWQIVMHERVAMDAFERAGCGKRVVLAHPESDTRGDEQKRPEALAAAKRCVAHGFSERGITGAASPIAGEQLGEPPLDEPSHAFELT